MIDRENKRPVTLEDLLRLKRAERPPAEFWNQFDRALRAKQLAAIVEKRPWWRSLPAAFASLARYRYQLPLGATAAIALTVFAVREFSAPKLQPVVEPAPESIVARAKVIAPMRASEPVAAPSAPAALTTEPETVVASLASSSIDRSGPEMMAENPERELTPTARFIATNLALAKAIDPAVAQTMLGAPRGFEARAVPSRAPAVEPLTQMASPSDARRARLLTAAAYAANASSLQPARAAEVRTRRLSDEQLYDTISRFGASGHTVSMKF